MSIQKRFLFSFGANIIKALLSFVTGVLLARGLGPTSYGNLAYLLGSFWALRALMDLGSSSAFYTFIAQRHRGGAYFYLYYSWLALQFIASIFLIFVLLPQSAIDYFWFGQARELIFLALVANFLQNQVWQTLVQIYESHRQTVQIQFASLVIVLAHLTLILVITYSNWLNIEIVLIGICAEYFFGVIYLANRGMKIWRKSDDGRGSAGITQALLEYFSYCKPMALMCIFAFIYEITDRWLLQYFSGSAQQAFYQIALQFSTVSLLAATSLLNVFWKEIAEANERQQHKSVIELYEKATRILVIFGAYIACFLLPWSRELTIVMLGKEYYPAWPALMIMFLYPIHQVMGQVNGALFMATGETKTYTTIGNLGLIISIPISFLLLAPSSGGFMPGFGLGALGLAIKMVVLNIIFVNIQSYFIAKRYAVPMQWAVQLKVIFIFSSMAFLIYFLVGRVEEGLSKVVLIRQFILAGSIYTLGIIFIVLKRPYLIGLKNIDAVIFQGWLNLLLRR